VYNRMGSLTAWRVSPLASRAAASVGTDDRALRVGDQQLRLSTDDEAGIR